MQFALSSLVKLSVFAIMANTAAVVALPEPAGLEGRQLSCLGDVCTPGVAGSCCAGASCTGVNGVNVLDIQIPGLCTPATCDVICSTDADCCADVPNTTFTCQQVVQVLGGVNIGVCDPKSSIL